ncbi:MAG TPA: hypothetical protein VGK74_17260 [Symbiobacteriaceae bacterium]|jgi:hypothetical protein
MATNAGAGVGEPTAGTSKGFHAGAATAISFAAAAGSYAFDVWVPPEAAAAAFVTERYQSTWRNTQGVTVICPRSPDIIKAKEGVPSRLVDRVMSKSGNMDLAVASITASSNAGLVLLRTYTVLVLTTR